MGYARSQLIDPTVSGTYHCVSRCVRRAFLCGEDPLSGRNLDHRKQWIEDRLLLLAESFSASVLAYAVMSNHVHVVVHMAPEAVADWTDLEVAERWVRLFPVKVDDQIEPGLCRRKIAAIAGNAERVAELRARLGSLSWLMRCLVEPIARQANEEDGCTGRFWEGRFKCQVLLDDAAVLACMAYVDLNPIRAGIAPDLPTSHHTSIQRRLAGSDARTRAIAAVAGPALLGFLPIHESEYIELLDWTGRQLRSDKRGVIDAHAPAALRFHANAERWIAQVQGIENRYWRAIGEVDALIDKARMIGQCWLKGRRTAAIA